jgi:hypothetical protein
MKEEFYDTYFPNDIPDEWSAADREKSHSRGLGRDPEAALDKYINTIFQRSQTLGMWRHGPIDYKYDESAQFEDFYETMRSKCSDTLVAQLPLKATKKIFTMV